MASTEIERLITALSRLPGLGPRSARRAALFLIQKKSSVLDPLQTALKDAGEAVRTCATCGNMDTADPCGICRDEKRDPVLLCVVESVADLWAMERSGAFRGRYHVLGGTLSAIDGVGPDDLNIPGLVARVKGNGIGEVVVATNATVDGQTTAHYIAECLDGSGARVSGLAHGVPVGGEIDYLDEGTLTAALKARRDI